MLNANKLAYLGLRNPDSVLLDSRDVCAHKHQNVTLCDAPVRANTLTLVPDGLTNRDVDKLFPNVIYFCAIK